MLHGVVGMKSGKSAVLVQSHFYGPRKVLKDFRFNEIDEETPVSDLRELIPYGGVSSGSASVCVKVANLVVFSWHL